MSPPPIRGLSWLLNGPARRDVGATRDYRISRWRYLQPDGTWGVWDRNADGSLRGVAVQGGQESGVEECIMRYHQESFYETSKGRVQWEDPDGSLQRGAKYPPMELAGTIFCDDDKGTGVNAPHRRGESEGGQRLQREM